MPAAAAVVALNIRAERARRRWKQSELAERVPGWTIQIVSDTETGKRKLSIDDLIGLCAAFGVPLSQLLQGADASAFDALGI